MTDQELETHARNLCAKEIEVLEANSWQEVDIDFDDSEVRIVFEHPANSDCTMTVMYQPEEDEDDEV